MRPELQGLPSLVKGELLHVLYMQAVAMQATAEGFSCVHLRRGPEFVVVLTLEGVEFGDMA